ncbi:hypothetical protein [Kutzneria kofuensis]|uniref:Uncharacterized protein n=1 Tax=Kutzneria kofuensis TaxID=103725 RepID=A0A7W9NF10_9PSEU|nr:hypothetical protein [Kutzneria kofuensis]MBB5890019.1 hypothetical protein [Kutzneria kofuensis]
MGRRTHPEHGPIHVLVRQFLPDAVIGTYFLGSFPNGDFAISHDDLLTADTARLRRLSPAQ